MSEGIEKETSVTTAESDDKQSKSVDDKTTSKKSSNKKEKSSVDKITIWFKEVVAEYSKVAWPNKKDLAKMTLTVIVTSLMFAILIAFFDAVLHYGFTNLVRL